MDVRPSSHVISPSTETESVNFWDQNYSVEGYKYGLEPNAFLAQQAHRLPAAAAVLLPGDGEGRNGVWLARQGHQVTSVDASMVGLEKARKLAAQAGVELATCLADLSDWSPATASVDAVVLTYVHLPPGIRGEVHRRLAQALKPGGLLILESFHPRQLNFSSGGPKAAELLYSLEILRADFAAFLDEVLAWEGESCLDEGPGHQGAAYVTRWIGQAR